MFNQKFIQFCEQPDLETQEVEGKRHYLVNDKLYPSVTTVLGSVPKPQLDQWRQRVGEEAASIRTFQATDRGQQLHSMIEKYLLGQQLDYRSEMPHIVEMFTWIKPLLDKHVTDIYGIEAALYSDKLRMAGRADLIAAWDGEPCIIDFKTSFKSKRVEWLSGYFQQGATYSYMAWERVKMMAAQTVIIVATENTKRADVFIDSCGPRIPEVIEIAKNYHAAVDSGMIIS